MNPERIFKIRLTKNIGKGITMIPVDTIHWANYTEDGDIRIYWKTEARIIPADAWGKISEA